MYLLFLLCYCIWFFSSSLFVLHCYMVLFAVNKPIIIIIIIIFNIKIEVFFCRLNFLKLFRRL
jgi:predicted membrane-bound dolichyl-phosphate-mannose-protein mannosyltransferase